MSTSITSQSGATPTYAVTVTASDKAEDLVIVEKQNVTEPFNMRSYIGGNKDKGVNEALKRSRALNAIDDAIVTLSSSVSDLANAVDSRPIRELMIKSIALLAHDVIPHASVLYIRSEKEADGYYYATMWQGESASGRSLFKGTRGKYHAEALNGLFASLIKSAEQMVKKRELKTYFKRGSYDYKMVVSAAESAVGDERLGRSHSHCQIM